MKFLDFGHLGKVVESSKNVSQVIIEDGFITNKIPSITVKLTDFNHDCIVDGLREVADAFDFPFILGRSEQGEHKIAPKKVHMNDPWTVIEWKDGTKSKLKCHDDDTYNPLYGIIRNVIRKVGHNKVRVDSWEYIIESLSEFIENPDEVAFLQEVLGVLYDVMTLDGAMERLADYDVRNKPEDSAEEVRANIIDAIERTQDEIRQMVRNLQLDGEL